MKQILNDISAHLDSLNSRQREAVTAPDGPVLVTAGAGSGKTAVLVNRIAWLISARNVPANRIIAVTFTNKAAREMKQRVQALLWDEPIEPVVGTFHGLCNQFLRTRYQEAGLDRYFSIMDQDDQKLFISSLMKSENLRFGDITPQKVQAYINRCKESKQRAGEDEIYSDRYRVLASIYQVYEHQCEAQGRVDFAELILRTVEVMERNAKVREHIQERFLHVLIDEFQDTNELQYQWMELFGGKSRNITAVGDEDQSIYSWRGALAGNLKRFENTYSDALVIRLEQNYRSTKHILDGANALIKHNSNRFEKKLWTGKKGGSRIRFMSANDSGEEAYFIADQIQQIESASRKLSDFAVLYRTNAQSRNFEETFGAQGIPFRVYGGVRFYQRREVKDIVCYLQLIANPNATDALLRAINSPPRGIGDVAKHRITECADEQGISIWDATVELAETGSRWTKIKQFVDLIVELKDVSETVSLGELIALTIDRSGMRDRYENHADPTERDRIVNLDELINAGVAFEDSRSADVSSEILGEYLDSVALDPGDTHSDEPEEKVQLMTLHSAKGLEFPVVFLSGLDESILPHFFSTQGNNQFRSENEDAIEEERRLCYVGMTRAEEVLYITRANRRMVRGEWQYFQRSRFLREIPKRLLEYVNLVSTPGELALDGDDHNETNSGYTEWLGKSVQHKKFGQGVVIDVEPNNKDPYLTIEFDKFGSKTILSEFVSVVRD